MALKALGACLIAVLFIASAEQKAIQIETGSMYLRHMCDLVNYTSFKIVKLFDSIVKKWR